MVTAFAAVPSPGAGTMRQAVHADMTAYARIARCPFLACLSTRVFHC